MYMYVFIYIYISFDAHLYLYLQLYINIYAFRRHFYPKRLTMHSGYIFIVSMYMKYEYEMT